MTTLLREACEMSIADCLQQHAEAVRAVDGAGWEFTLRGEVPLPVTARLKNGWLRMRAPLGVQSSSRPAPEILARMLEQNAELAGGAKFALADDPLVPCLAADILLDEEETALGPKISRVCDGFSQALQEFAGGHNPRESRREDAQSISNQEELGRVGFRCDGACAKRPAGR